MGLMFREQPEKAATDPEEADSAGYVDQDRTDHARKCRRIPAGSRDLGLGKSPLTSDCRCERRLESACIRWVVPRRESRHDQTD